MKTKAQKQEELKKGKELFGKSEILVFTDFSKVPAEDLRKFRRSLKEINASLLVMKKRLLGVLLKEKGVDFNSKQFESSVGTVFSGANLESISAAVFKFFSTLGDPKAKEVSVKKILGGYDVKAKSPVEREKIVMIGQLPSREVLLGQLLGVLAGPIRALLYVLKEKSKAQ
ncbi:50S ribosomal protein L10 [Candidatus Parcubacteria bacterium]|nr:MAG: 50S ribosomal protein L10 [Candidatus Parcubacteria bacterium]